MIRMIATDLDRTVLMPKQPLPPELFPLIQDIQSRGIRFVACSGRQYPNMRRLFRPIVDEISYVTTNGAMSLVHDEVVDIHIIPRQDALAICKDIMDAGMNLLVDTKHSVYLFGDNQDYLKLVLYDIRNTSTVMRDLNELPDDIIKVSGYIPVGLYNIIPPIVKRWEKRYTATPGGPQWFDVTMANKATGLAALCSHFNIDPMDVMAFGDSFNDEPMLDFVGHPFIISTAHEQMKKPRYTVFDNEITELKKFLNMLG